MIVTTAMISMTVMIDNQGDIMTRIKYLKEGSLLTSKATIVCGLHNVSVKLFVDLKSFQLVDVDSGDVLVVGEAKTESALKIAAKSELKKLGAIFGDEIRRHTNDLTEESSNDLTDNGIAC